MAGLLGAFQGKVHISFKLDGAEGRRTVTMKRGATRQAEKLPLFREGETVAGTVVITPTSARRVEHQGLKIELLGQAGAAARFERESVRAGTDRRSCRRRRVHAWELTPLLRCATC